MARSTSYSELLVDARYEIWLDDYLVGVEDFDVPPHLILLFRPEDRRTIAGRPDQLPVDSRIWMKDVSLDQTVNCVYYTAPISVIRDRLDLLGFTFDAAQLACERERLHRIARNRRLIEEHGDTFGPIIEEAEKPIPAQTWVEALKEIRARGLLPLTNYGQTCCQVDPAVTRLLHMESLGCSAPELAIRLRLAIDAMPDDTQCILDLTESLQYSPDLLSCDFIEYAKPWDEDEVMTRNVIVLTEGSTDAWILSESMELLYPHLSSYFSFLDFSDCNVSGGAGNLANIVKAFSGAGIINRVVALFDNDTGAKNALRGLQDITIPNNVVIRQLPDISLLESYPTLGPTGLTNMNVNGMAGGIELYLGEDILRDSDGHYFPVQWTGYSSGVRKYQGEVLSKSHIQHSFRTKLERCTADQDYIAQTDWSGIRAILNSLFTAFHRYDRERLLSWIDRSWDF